MFLLNLFELSAIIGFIVSIESSLLIKELCFALDGDIVAALYSSRFKCLDADIFISFNWNLIFLRASSLSKLISLRILSEFSHLAEISELGFDFNWLRFSVGLTALLEHGLVEEPFLRVIELLFN